MTCKSKKHLNSSVQSNVKWCTSRSVVPWAIVVHVKVKYCHLSLKWVTCRTLGFRVSIHCLLQDMSNLLLSWRGFLVLPFCYVSTCWIHLAREWGSKISKHYVVALLYYTPTYEWYMARLVVSKRGLKLKCLYEIRFCAQIVATILASIFN